MAGILADWEQTKKDLATAVSVELKTGSLSADYVAAIKKVVKTDTGLTPALKEFDGANFKKGTQAGHARADEAAHGHREDSQADRRPHFAGQQ